MNKKQLISTAEQWLTLPYESYDYGLALYTQLRLLLNDRLCPDTIHVKRLMSRIDDRLFTLRKLSARTYRNVVVIDGKRTVLPIVAYVPVRRYDDESGTLQVVPPYIDLSKAATNEEKCKLIKAEADRLTTKRKKKCAYSNTAATPNT